MTTVREEEEEGADIGIIIVIIVPCIIPVLCDIIDLMCVFVFLQPGNCVTCYDGIDGDIVWLIPFYPVCDMTLLLYCDLHCAPYDIVLYCPTHYLHLFIVYY